MKLVLKVSGEILDLKNLEKSKEDFSLFIKKLKDNGHQISVIIGGGNLFRGRENLHMLELNRDTIGIFASVTNALHIHDILLRNKIPAIVSTPFNLNNLIPYYSEEELINKIGDYVIIFGGGIGKIGVSTDTKCFEVAKLFNADMIVKLTNVNGIYDKDPKRNLGASFIKRISYDEVIEKDIKVIDLGIIEACKINNIKIKVMNYKDKDEILNDNVGSIIGE